MSIPTLEKQILATIVYYDILDYPLTVFEVFLYLINDRRRHSGMSPSGPIKLSGIVELLENSEYLREHTSRKYGFYFLKDREKIVQQRLYRKKLADQKWKKTRKIFWIMQVAPFMKMVLVSGSLALGNSREDSDIDVIIVAKKGRIWLVRTFVTLLTSLLGARRRGKTTKDKICLNHYITDKSLKIPFESLYNAQSYAHLASLYDYSKDRKLFRQFQEENEWIKKYVENYRLSELGSFRSVKRSGILSFVSKFFEIIFLGSFGDILENELSQIQSKKIKSDPVSRKKGGRVTISDDQLEFHPDSHEGIIIPEFNGRMEKLGLFEFANQKDSGLVK